MYKQKLVDLLCEVEEVKKDLEELRFGTDLFYINGQEGINEHETFIGMSHPYNGASPYPILKNHHNYCIIKEWIDLKLYTKRNPLDYHHLMMYCEEKKINFTMEQFSGLRNIKFYLCIGSEQIILNYKKSFNNQSEEVYEQIFKYLSNLK